MNKVQQEIITLPMTSNNSSGQVVSASYTPNSLYSIYNEGGHIGAGAMRIISGSKIGHTTIQLSEPLVANKVILRFGGSYFSKNFQIQGSNDGVNFDDLFTVENNTETELSLTFDNDKEYVYYRFYSTDAPLNFVDLYQINYYKTYTVYTSKILLLSDKKRKLIQQKTIEHELKMTSNNTPSPIIIEASTEYSSNYGGAWRAFNGSNTGGSVSSMDAWRTPSQTKTGWISIDFGETKRVLAISISAMDNTFTHYLPRDFEVLGKNKSDKNWNILGEFKEVTGWVRNETRTFHLDREYSFQQYRINVIRNNDGDSLGIGLIQFYYDLTTIMEFSSQSEQDFINHGMSSQELSEIDFSSDFTEKHYIQNQSTPLGSGKVFEQALDVDKIIKSVKIE